ncbi:hypothetical protein C4J81_13485 [Deltaproteobacteria bacterium Smac51]|nr:hypothetical protein C4J81_13485 [Deltaproteobacteria bacterium Smac51]
MKKSPVIMVGLAALTYIICIWQRISPPVVALDVLTELGLEPDQMSLIFALTFFGYGLAQPVAGYCVDRFGPRRCLLFSALVMGLGSICFSYSESFLTACLSRTIMGTASGLALLPGLRLCMNWLPPERFNVAISFIFSASALGNFLVGRPLAQVTGAFGWRFPYFWVGVLTLGLMVVLWFVVADKPEGADDGDQSQTPSISFIETARVILSDRRFWMIGGMYIGTDILYLTFTSLWSGPYLIEVHGLSTVSVGNILSVAAISFLIGPPLIALWADRWGSYLKVLLFMTVFNLLTVSFIMWGPADLSLWQLYVLCFLAPLGGQAAGLIMTLSRDTFPHSVSTSGMGFLNFMPIMGGASFQQLIGYIMTRTEMSMPEAAAQSRYAVAYFPAWLWTILAIILCLMLLRMYARPKESNGCGHAAADD